MAISKFARDLDALLLEIESKSNPAVMIRLRELRERLVTLKKKRLVKINHSVLEILLARYLLETGYAVEVEAALNEENLIADILASWMSDKEQDNLSHAIEQEISRNESETLLVEIETGFVPPSAALNPGEYRQARISAKLARYSCLADRFALAVPFYHLLQIPVMYLKDPTARTEVEAQEIKRICDIYYQSPPIPLEKLYSAELDAVYLIDVDNKRVSRLSPRSYLEYLRGPTDLFKSVT